MIRQTEAEGEYLLLCEADAVPDDVTFTWRFDNVTLTERIRTEGSVSTLTVRPGSRDFGTYSCHVNNSVGAGVPCEIDVAGEMKNLKWKFYASTSCSDSCTKIQMFQRRYLARNMVVLKHARATSVNYLVATARCKL